MITISGISVHKLFGAPIKKCRKQPEPKKSTIYLLPNQFAPKCPNVSLNVLAKNEVFYLLIAQKSNENKACFS